MRKWAKKTKDKARFDGNREEVIKRDNFQCTNCNINREKHYKKYNRDLNIHHKDKNRKNNHIENLITVCASCHLKCFHPIGEHIDLKKPWNKGLRY